MTHPVPELSSALQAALARHNAGDLAGASAAYRRLLARFPGNADLYRLLGIALLQLGKAVEAAELLDKALAARPDDAGTRLYRGRARAQAGLLPQALEDYSQVAESGGAHAAEAWFSLGRLRRANGEREAALQCYDRGLALKPDDGRVWFNRGNALGEAGRMAEAIESYAQATRLLPDFAAAWFNLGTALLGSARAAEAIPVFEHLLRLQPDHGDALINLGNAWRSEGRDDRAADVYRRALAIEPARAETHNNLASILLAEGDIASALRHFDAAMLAAPDQVIFHLGKASALKQAGRLDEALLVFDKAVEVAPTHVEARTSRSLCQLLAGRLPEGLVEYEWRWQSPDLSGVRPNFPKPLWLGQADIRGKRLLVRWEQGLGDTIQFSRYVSLLNALGAEVILQVQPPLLSLLRGLSGRGVLLAEGQPLPEFDYHVPMLSLPLACRTTLATVPAVDRYLSVDSGRLAAWRARLGEVRGMRIGVAWSGRPEHKNDKQRSLSLAQFLAALPEGPTYFVLQKDVRETDAALLATQSAFVNLAADFGDFSDTAAVCELMDLVISVDTSIAHLAGALGRPLWLLLPFVPDWRWLMGRSDTPWYPSASIFRQGEDKDWLPVLQQVRVALSKKQDDFAKG